jgi:hypothetical protein
MQELITCFVSSAIHNQPFEAVKKWTDDEWEIKSVIPLVFRRYRRSL